MFFFFNTHKNKEIDIEVKGARYKEVRQEDKEDEECMGEEGKGEE